VAGADADGESLLILGIETSCDETAAALVDEDGSVLSSVVSSQANLHARYGGVVPEVASRRHLELVTPVIQEALRDADARLEDVELVGVTTGPGLIGALLVGVAAAKSIAWA
jgi:N6-L-threonylcarbamoyladenine synthase